MSRILIKVTNGSKVYIENVTDILLNNKIDKYDYREIKIKETDIKFHSDHFIYEWSESFYESDNLPDWVIKSATLEFELLICDE